MKFSTLLLILISVSSFAQEKKLDCNNAITTLDINRCMSLELEKVESTMETYLSKSKERHKEDNVSSKSIEKSQDIWLKYRESHCNAIYDTWREGTIRNSMFIRCKIDLTQKRTKELWSYYLTFMDSTPSILPEPNPISYQNVLDVVTSDWNGDGSFDRAVLVSSKNDLTEVALYIYLSDSSKDSLKLAVHKKGIAWAGGFWGTLPSLDTNKRGSLVITSANESIGRSRWSQDLTLAYRNNGFVVAGYTYTARDTLDLDYSLICDVNLLTGQVKRNEKSFKTLEKEINVLDWLDSHIPKECR